jgi:hypothetical protein
VQWLLLLLLWLLLLVVSCQEVPPAGSIAGVPGAAQLLLYAPAATQTTSL